MPTTVQAVIATARLAHLLRFYTDLLDGTEATRWPADGPPFYVGLEIGHSLLGLVAEDGSEDEPDQGSRPHPAPDVRSVGSRILLTVDVEQVDALLPRVEPAGGRLLGPPRDMPWGQRVVHVLDPDGNAVNLTQTL